MGTDRAGSRSGSSRRRARRRTRVDRAVVLRRFPYGDSSLVVRLLTRDHGRAQILAKGAYRPKSRYSGVLDLFDELSVSWKDGGPGALGLLVEASILRRRRELSRGLDRYRAALSVLELAELGAREGEGEAELFELVRQVLDLLDAGRVDPALALVAYDLRFLRAMGLLPALDGCAACGARAGGGRRSRVAFSFRDGGRLCARCAEQARAGGGEVEEVRPATLRIAWGLLDAPLRNLPRTRVAAGSFSHVERLVSRFLEYHLETRPRSRESPGESTGRRTARPPIPR